MKILVTGAGGMVGQALNQYCGLAGDKVLTYDHQALDIADADQVQAAILSASPDAVINCAAWTDVDGCELDPVRAHAAHATGPENLAKASRMVSAGFVTISTDYVFDGQAGNYKELDSENPINWYGTTKLEGEKEIIGKVEPSRWCIARTSTPFGTHPRKISFPVFVLRNLKNGELVNAVSDQFTSPTYANNLAKMLHEIVCRSTAWRFATGPGRNPGWRNARL